MQNGTRTRHSSSLHSETMGSFRGLTAAALLFACFKYTFSFPDGAPAEACDSLLPRHAGTSPSPVAESPYVFVASDDKYSYNNPNPIKGKLKYLIFVFRFFLTGKIPEGKKKVEGVSGIQKTKII